MNQQDLFEYIRIVRKRQGINQDEMAKEIGCTRPHVANLESGLCRCPLPTFLIICNYLKISLAEFEDDEIIEQVRDKRKIFTEVKEKKKEIRKLNKEIIALEGDI